MALSVDGSHGIEDPVNSAFVEIPAQALITLNPHKTGVD